MATESEYAAWLAAIGFHANHFTVFVNALDPPLNDLAEVLDWVEAHGYEISKSGGRIKGGEHMMLAQGATRADRRPVSFSDGVYEIPTFYYEFAHRFSSPTGQIYQGFVSSNADKIFESTHRSI